MQPDAPALIWDAHRAAGLVREFITGRLAVDYESDVMLRSTVERQFEVSVSGWLSTVPDDQEATCRVSPHSASLFLGDIQDVSYGNSGRLKVERGRVPTARKPGPCMPGVLELLG